MVGEGIQIVGVAGPWSNVEQGANVERGVLHIAILLDHGLLEVGPCFLIFGLKDGPAVDYPLAIAKQGRSGVAESGILGPTKRGFHGFHVGTPCDHHHSDIVFFATEDQDLFLFNLQKRSMCCDDLVCCIVGQDLLLLLLGGSGNAVAGRGCRVVHLDALALAEIV